MLFLIMYKFCLGLFFQTNSATLYFLFPQFESNSVNNTLGRRNVVLLSEAKLNYLKHQNLEGTIVRKNINI